MSQKKVHGRPHHLPIFRAIPDPRTYDGTYFKQEVVPFINKSLMNILVTRMLLIISFSLLKKKIAHNICILNRVDNFPNQGELTVTDV